MDFSKGKIERLIVHEVGNKLRDEKVFLSMELQIIDKELERLLLNFFLKSFLTGKDEFCFTHSSSLELNEVNTYTKEIFENSSEEEFIGSSHSIAKHLYECSLHPKITCGELIVVQISGIYSKNKQFDAVGIFKSENKDTFLKTVRREKSIKIKGEKGINASKIDKGCLILNSDEKVNSFLFNIDNQNKLTNYWSNKFLNIDHIDDYHNKTKKILAFFKDFSEQKLLNKYEKKVEIEFGNNYINYFESNEIYQRDTAIEVIFTDDGIKKEFDKYKDAKKAEFDFDSYESFNLSKVDISREKRRVNNVIKLDTKLEIKVLLNKENGTDNIEKGYDKLKKMHYYKIYFNEELN